MSIGITGTGVYIPYYFISRATIAQQWDAAPRKGVRSLCNADEDSVTMAAEAATNCLRAVGREGVDGLFFASTTAPYAEKSHASILAKVCDLPDSCETADFLAATRAGLSAVRSAYASVKAGLCRSVLVAGADQRNGYPKSQQEMNFGDAAAALTIGSDKVLAEIAEFESVGVEIHDSWRNVKDDYLRSGEGRFVKSKGYSYALKEVVKRLMSRRNLTAQSISKLILPGETAKEQLGTAKALGFSPEQLQDSLLESVGDCGTAQPLLLLTAALETARPGDLILCCAYGSGAEATLLKVTENVPEMRNRGELGKYLSARRELSGYPRFLSFRGLIEAEPGEPYKINPSGSAYWREQNSILSLHGSRCRKCGQIMFPINRICYCCHSKDDFDEVRLYDRSFSLFTFSIDRLAGRSDDPVIGQAVAEDGEGTRIYMLITDFREEDIRVGMKLEFTFRKMHNLGDFVNYYWKMRPVRRGEE